MRPITLTFQAIGPFVEKQTIDFRKYYDDGIFLIHGETGSGKTFILDCIMLSLFGVGSGADRPNINECRSQFAPAELATEIEFTFELDHKEYSFFRCFRVSGKNATSIANAFMFENGIKIPFFASPTMTKVNEKAEELLGLNANQFTQVIILPQGKFEQFLVGKSEEKRKVLTCLFDLELWQNVVEELRRNLNFLKNDCDKKENYISETLLTFNVCAIDELKNRVLETKKEYAKAKLIVNMKKTRLETLSKQRDNANELVVKFEKFDENVKRRDSLTADETKNHLLKREISKIENAIRINSYYSQFEEKAKMLDMQEKEIESLNGKKINQELELESAEKIYNNLKSVEPANEQLKMRFNIFQSKRQVYENIEKIKTEVAFLQDKKTRNDLENIKLSNCLSLNKEKYDILYQEQQNRYKNFVKQIASVKANSQRMQDSVAFQKEERNLQTEIEKLDKFLLEKSGIYKILYEENLKNAAELLKNNLRDGDNCPVCGSVAHNIVIKADKNGQVATDLQALVDEINGLKVELSTKNTRLTQVLSQLQTIGIYTESQFEIADQKFKQCQIEVDNFDISNIELKRLKDIFEESSANLKIFEEATKALEKNYLNKSAEYQAAKAQLIPDVKDLVCLQSQIDGMSRKIKNHSDNCAIYQQKVDCLKNEMASLDGQLKSIQASSKLIKQDIVSKRLQFLKILTEKGFEDEQDFLKSLQMQYQLEDKKSATQKFENELNIIQNSISVLEKELAQKQRVDINLINNEFIAEQLQLENVRSEFTILGETKRTLENQLAELTIKQTELTVLQKKYNHLKSFTDILAGSTGSNNCIGIQNYCLATMLGKILIEANKILKNVLNDNFKLHRATEKRGREKDTGLELDVEDLSSGQRRSVRTLSGGEKFIVALSLSMALSNVLMMYANGVKIDMLFIDEGFGTLSESRVKDALDILLKDKNGNRLIGIISHVQKIYDSVPAKIYVIKNRVSCIKQ